jgi:hypothetical protein
LEHLRTTGLTVIVSDGDLVLQTEKIIKSHLAEATDFLKVYASVIPEEQHTTVGKETGETAHMERKSGRRGSNPRQPAWEAGTRKNNGRLLSNGSVGSSTTSTRVSSTPEAGFSFLMGQAFTQLLFQSYPLPFWKASFVGKMFYMSLFVNDASFSVA